MGGTLESYQSKIAGVLLNTYGKPNREGRRSPGMNPDASNKENSQFVYVGLEEKSSATLAISAEKAL